MGLGFRTTLLQLLYINYTNRKTNIQAAGLADFHTYNQLFVFIIIYRVNCNKVMFALTHNHNTTATDSLLQAALDWQTFTPIIKALYRLLLNRVACRHS